MCIYIYCKSIERNGSILSFMVSERFLNQNPWFLSFSRFSIYPPLVPPVWLALGPYPSPSSTMVIEKGTTEEPFGISNIRTYVTLNLDLEELNYDAWCELFEACCISFDVQPPLNPMCSGRDLILLSSCGCMVQSKHPSFIWFSLKVSLHTIFDLV